MSDSIHRRRFIEVAAATGFAAASRASRAARSEGVDTREVASGKPFLTQAENFVDVSRGKPKPHTLRGEALAKARLTPETWRLEIVGDDSSQVARPVRLEDGTALDLARLKELGKSRGVRFLKALQCNNIPVPLGQGLWEGVSLRDVLRLVGNVGNVRRVYYRGFHNDDPAQVFQSSLGYNQAIETPPWYPPPLVAYRLNGREIPLNRGGPVRMIVPWAHGFKSIKWLQRIVLTNDYQANDTYALQNNDPDSYLKTAAYLDPGPQSFKAGEPVVVEGTAISGWSGLSRVEYWLRTVASPGVGPSGPLAEDDPAWKTAVWHTCAMMPPPGDWVGLLPEETVPATVWGFDPRGKPREWPLPFSVVPWSARLTGLAAGAYEFRSRTVDLNGDAQPEPRPYQKSGMNRIQSRPFVVTP